MVEKCLIAASLAALVCHPSATITCFKPKPKDKDPKPPSHSPTPKDSKPHVKKEEPSKPHVKEEMPSKSYVMKEVPSKANKKKPHHPHAGSSSSSTSTSAKTAIANRSNKTPKPINVVSELVGGDPSIGVVESIIRSGWAGEMGLTIEKVLRVNHSLDVFHGFEEYREMIKSKYEKGRIVKKMERLVVDGNELLQFHGAIITCSLGNNGVSTICQRKCCQVCRIIALEFCTEDGTVSFFDNSWRAHEKVTSECLAKRVCTRKAIVVCRVIAGRIAHYHADRLTDNEEGGFDSVMEWSGDQFGESKELVVFNLEAVLPCFVILYNVKKNLS